MATTALPLICPQGHGPGFPGTRFCVSCGSQLVAPLVPGQQLPGAPPAPLQGYMPVPQGSAPPQAPTPPPQAWSPVSQTSTPPQAWSPVPQTSAPPQTWQPPAPVAAAPKCNLCGGNGAGLDPAEDVCPQCSWLRPLFPGYQLDRSVFLWAQDGKAMAALQSLPALHAVVKAVSDKVGRPWIESTFNAIRLGPKQLPDVWKQAVLAARILGLPYMPDVYISGDRCGTPIPTAPKRVRSSCWAPPTSLTSLTTSCFLCWLARWDTAAPAMRFGKLSLVLSPAIPRAHRPAFRRTAERDQPHEIDPWRAGFAADGVGAPVGDYGRPRRIAGRR